MLKANKYDILYLLEVNTEKIAYMCVFSTNYRAKYHRNFDNKIVADVAKLQSLKHMHEETGQINFWECLLPFGPECLSSQ